MSQTSSKLPGAEPEARGFVGRAVEILESIQDGFFALDRNWDFTYVNKRAAEIADLAPEDIVGRNIWEDYPQLLGTEIETAYRAVMHDRAPVQLEHVGLGSSTWFKIRVYPAGDGGISVYWLDCTKRKCAEEKLHKMKDELERRVLERMAEVQLSNDKLTTLIDSIPDEVWFTDSNKMVTLVNPAVLREFGDASHNDSVENIASAFEVYRPDGTPRPVKESPPLRALNGEVVQNQEEIVRMPASGELRYRQVNASPVRNACGNIIGSISIVRDITARKRVEKALRESEHELEESNHQKIDILESISDCFYALDRDLRFIYVNNAAEDIWGLSRADLIGHKIEDVFTDLIEISLSKFRLVLAEQIPQHYEVYSKVIQRWGDMSVYPTRDGISVYFRDTTERKRAEEALWESEKKYRDLFNSIDEGFCIIEVLFDDNDRPLDFRFLEVNQAFERQTGLTNAAGRCMRDMVPDNEQHWSDIFGHIAITGESVRFQSPAEALGRVYDVYAFRVGEPEQQRVAVIFNDITERRRVEEALREADRQKNQFLATLSHELRNPLAAIRSGLSILNRVQPGTEQERRAKAVIDRQSEQLCQLVDDLLDVTRITQNKITLHRETLDLNEVIRRVVEDHHESLRESGLEVGLDLTENSLIIYGDGTRLAQVFWNLLHNAVKFTPRGGRISITAELDAPQEQAVVVIADSGVGIPSEAIHKLFQPFVQIDSSLERRNGGLGLGLALVKGLVDLHGGQVSVSSSGPGAGAEFTIWLPLDKDCAEVVAAAASIIIHPRRILLIDDNHDLADTLRELLEIDDHKVAVAYSGPEGLHKAREFSPDVVLCDIGMPGMGGYEVARLIRADATISKVFLIALTGYAQPEDLQRVMTVGFDMHLAKPVELSTLQQILAELPA